MHCAATAVIVEIHAIAPEFGWRGKPVKRFQPCGIILLVQQLL